MPTRRVSPTIAHVGPFVVFLCFTALAPLFTVENTMLPWWRHAPEQWIYPFQTIVIALLLWSWRGQYTFGPLSGIGLATLFGSIGFIWWCFPAFLAQRLITSGSAVPHWAEWLGFTSRTRGFNPTFFRNHSFWYALALTMRFVRMVVIVPFAEEIFWRGFLM